MIFMIFGEKIFFDDGKMKNQKKVKIMFRVKVLHLAGTEKWKNQEFLKICDFLEN